MKANSLYWDDHWTSEGEDKWDASRKEIIKQIEEAEKKAKETTTNSSEEKKDSGRGSREGGQAHLHAMHGGTRADFFTCSTHRADKDKCSGHYIRAVVLEDKVWKRMKAVILYMTRYEAYFRSKMEHKLHLESVENNRVYREYLAQAEK